MIFSDPEIVELLKTRFVPLALDDWYHRRRQDAEGEFLRGVLKQEVTRTDFKQSTQGRYAFSADGRLFGFDNHGTEGLERTKRLLRKALEEFRAPESVGAEAQRADPRFDRTLPEGITVVDVTMKILAGYRKTDEARDAFRGILGRERMWVRKDEVESLSRGEFPASLGQRLVRFHLFDNTRGQHSYGWAAEDVKQAEFTLKDGRLAGRVRLEAGGRRLAAELLGFVECREGRLARFDLVAKAEASEESPRQDLPETEGTFTIAFSFRVADPKDAAYRVAPSCARDLNAYVR